MQLNRWEVTANLKVASNTAGGAEVFEVSRWAQTGGR